MSSRRRVRVGSGRRDESLQHLGLPRQRVTQQPGPTTAAVEPAAEEAPARQDDGPDKAPPAAAPKIVMQSTPGGGGWDDGYGDRGHDGDELEPPGTVDVSADGGASQGTSPIDNLQQSQELLVLGGGAAKQVQRGESIEDVEVDVAGTTAKDHVHAKHAEAKDKANQRLEFVESITKTSKPFATGEMSAGKLAAGRVIDGMQDKMGMKIAEVDEKFQRKLCGLGEKGANKAKVVFILLTGLLALTEAVMITTTSQQSVYIDIGFALETAGQTEILSVFNASAFLPPCITDAPGIGNYDSLPPPPPPLLPSLPPNVLPLSPPTMPLPIPPNAPPSIPPWSTNDQAINAVTSARSLTNLWYSDTAESGCESDLLYSGEATVADCGNEPRWCGACSDDLDEELKGDTPTWCVEVCNGDFRKHGEWQAQWAE